jgi:hypothetical protein
MPLRIQGASTKTVESVYHVDKQLQDEYVDLTLAICGSPYLFIQNELALTEKFTTLVNRRSTPSDHVEALG